MTSLLARAKFIPISVIQEKLNECCIWIHEYIQRCDIGRNTNVLRAHLLFYSMCQSVFYIISFRCRDLTNSPKSKCFINESLIEGPNDTQSTEIHVFVLFSDLLFLNSLQLSTIVNCHLNPLRVCRPEVATAFAGITRTYQLAYCHSILERNARRKLALIYTNETAMPEDCLDTNYPFDPYILKKSGKRIESIYMQYQGGDSDDCEPTGEISTPPKDSAAGNAAGTVNSQLLRRKRTESATSTNAADDIDDFIVDKRQKISELSMSFERELQFNNI